MLVILAQLQNLVIQKTNDTLCIAGYQIIVPEIEFSTPYYGKAIVPLGKSNEEKLQMQLINS